METTGPFNRSVSNRIFAAFLSILLALPTGWGLVTYWTHDHRSDNPDWILSIFLNISMDLVVILFLISVLGIIWAMFMPSWAERLLEAAQRNFLKSLALLLAVILAMLAISYLTIYRA